MNQQVHLIKKRRVYTEDFKRYVVKEFESGNFSVPQLGKIYKIQTTVLYRWIYKFSNHNDKSYQIVEKHQSSSEKLKEYERRIAELEQALGRKQIKLDYLEKMIELANEDLGVDIKKNSNTPQSDGLKNTGRK